jgi:hypothetical protein
VNSPSLTDAIIVDEQTVQLVGTGFSSYSDWTAGAVFTGVAIAEGVIDSDT